MHICAEVKLLGTQCNPLLSTYVGLSGCNLILTYLSGNFIQHTWPYCRTNLHRDSILLSCKLALHPPSLGQPLVKFAQQPIGAESRKFRQLNGFLAAIAPTGQRACNATAVCWFLSLWGLHIYITIIAPNCGALFGELVQ